MPYIPQERRNDLIPVSADYARTPGELNYFITSEVVGYIHHLGGSESYSRLNEAIGVLECVKLELYRRMIAPYEDEKCRINGDVF